MNPVLSVLIPLVGGVGVVLIGMLAMGVHAARQAHSRPPSRRCVEVPKNECGICLGEFDNRKPSTITLLCGHRFHRDCIDRVHKNEVRRTCPVCAKDN